MRLLCQVSSCLLLLAVQGIIALPLSLKQASQSNLDPSEDEVMNCIVEVLSIVTSENVDDLSNSCRIMLNIAARRKELEFLPDDKLASSPQLDDVDFDDLSSQLAGIEANYQDENLPSSKRSQQLMTPDEEDALRDIIRKEIEESLVDNVKRDPLDATGGLNLNNLDGNADDEIMLANDDDGDEEFLVIPMSYLNGMNLDGLEQLQGISAPKAVKKSDEAIVNEPKDEEIINLEEEFLPKGENEKDASNDMENFMKLEKDLEALSDDFKLLDIQKK